MMFALRVVVREKGVRAGVVVASVVDGGVVVKRVVVVGRRGIAPGSLVAIFFYIFLYDAWDVFFFSPSSRPLARSLAFNVPGPRKGGNWSIPMVFFFCLSDFELGLLLSEGASKVAVSFP